MRRPFVYCYFSFVCCWLTNKHRYNIEHVTAFVQAANNQKAPLIIQFFPSSLEVTPSLVHAAAAAARSASVPIAVHLDHAQDENQILYAADNYPFDSIMVDMSHHEREENIEKTKKLKEYCHSKYIAVEAETGRIEGGEDGISDTGDLSGRDLNQCCSLSSLSSQVLIISP